MDISSKYKIVEKIINTDDDQLLSEINSLLGLSGKDFWDELPTKLKDGIEEARQEIKEGKGIPHHEVMADVRARFLNK